MYMVTVEGSFCAVHRVRLGDGTLEPLHGHDWQVRACFAGRDLDDSGMVVDFEAARSALQSTLDKLAHVDLNEHEGFAGLNPTAEVVARYVFDRLRDEGLTAIRRVDVTEAPGCSATFEC
ncbi:MAG: 6-carboxytetrahydropterin synthase [Planctomycetes bacterium]|nr:6-carboxytetrahydropterin synthase [Planctomycetota bacterium]MCH8967279.1 6-carboxytetrahydropterin synthase [Planctomycetota bacterium]